MFGTAKNFTFINCDINNTKKLDEIFSNKNFYSVIHLAAIVGDPACKLYSDLAIKTNWESSKWLLQNPEAAVFQKFICINMQ